MFGAVAASYLLLLLQTEWKGGSCKSQKVFFVGCRLRRSPPRSVSSFFAVAMSPHPKPFSSSPGASAAAATQLATTQFCSPPSARHPSGKRGESGVSPCHTHKTWAKKSRPNRPASLCNSFAGWDEHCWMARLRVEETTELASAPLMLKNMFVPFFLSPMHNLSFVKVPMEKTFVFFASFANCSFLLLPPPFLSRCCLSSSSSCSYFFRLCP